MTTLTIQIPTLAKKKAFVSLITAILLVAVAFYTLYLSRSAQLGRLKNSLIQQREIVKRAVAISDFATAYEALKDFKFEKPNFEMDPETKALYFESWNEFDLIKIVQTDESLSEYYRNMSEISLGPACRGVTEYEYLIKDADIKKVLLERLRKGAIMELGRRGG